MASGSNLFLCHNTAHGAGAGDLASLSAGGFHSHGFVAVVDHRNFFRIAVVACAAGVGDHTNLRTGCFGRYSTAVAVASRRNRFRNGIATGATGHHPAAVGSAGGRCNVLAVAVADCGNFFRITVAATASIGFAACFSTGGGVFADKRKLTGMHFFGNDLHIHSFAGKRRDRHRVKRHDQCSYQTEETLKFLTHFPSPIPFFMIDPVTLNASYSNPTCRIITVIKGTHGQTVFPRQNR